jgi:hypothetical protein
LGFVAAGAEAGFAVGTDGTGWLIPGGEETDGDVVACVELGTDGCCGADGDGEVGFGAEDSLPFCALRLAAGEAVRGGSV